MAYAPSVMTQLGRQLQLAADPASATLSGIVGDSSHTYGYHRAAAEVSTSDYSRQLEPDRIDIDPWAAAGIDISMNPWDMKIVTRRMLNSYADLLDPRLDEVREFIGTLDGVNVIRIDVWFRVQGTSDASHLWHLHVSILRRFVNNAYVMDKIYSVITGETLASWKARTNGGFMALEGVQAAELYNAQNIPHCFVRMLPQVAIRRGDGSTVLEPNWRVQTLKDIQTNAKVAADKPTASVDAEQLAAALVNNAAFVNTLADALVARVEPVLRRTVDQELDEAFQGGADDDPPTVTQ